MSAMQRRKGAAAENEFAKLAASYGFNAVRTRSGGGQTALDIAGIPGYAFEVKRCQRTEVNRWFREADAELGRAGSYDRPVVAHRRNGERWLATLDLSDLLDLIQAVQL